MFPTATAYYDETGILIREVYVIPGMSHQRITVCQYDSNRRVLKQTTSTTNPETVQTIEFEYSDGWRRQHFKTSVASITVTQSLDNGGNVIREVERDELTKSVRNRTEFL